MNWQLTFVLVSGIISMVTALSALFLSYKVFVRQKTIENENHFFGYKMEQYQIVIQHATELHDLYYNTFIDVKVQLQQTIPVKDAIDDLGDLVDEKTDQFRLILYKHSAFLQKEIIKNLDDFYNHLYHEAEITVADKIEISNIDQLIKHLIMYEDDLEEIINLMRTDIGIEAIDRRLK